MTMDDQTGEQLFGLLLAPTEQKCHFSFVSLLQIIILLCPTDKNFIIIKFKIMWN